MLSSTGSPDDLRHPEVNQLPEICDKSRQDTIKELSCSPGRFAASLETVELTAVLHYVHNASYDRIVWNVGHQVYGHRTLTGRCEALSINRKLGDIHPFPSPEEDEYGTSTRGCASGSISAAPGMAIAAAKKGDDQRHAIAIIGDGSMSGGLTLEELSNSPTTPDSLFIILNDNDTVINRSAGGMRQYPFNLVTSNRYNQLCSEASRLLFRLGAPSGERRRALARFGSSLKSMAAQQQNIFEGMSIRYPGPTDGHDTKNLLRVSYDIKGLEDPRIPYLHTVKGKGFAPAEKHATERHAPGKFDPVTEERSVANTERVPSLFQDVFRGMLVELAEANSRIVGTIPATPPGCLMNILMFKMSKRALDVGIAEGHAATLSGGMVRDSLRSSYNTYSSFMQRVHDNTIHDAAVQNLPVALCPGRARLIGENDSTHHGAFDMAYLRPMSNLIIASPMNEYELRRPMYTVQLPDGGPSVPRYLRGRGVLVGWKCPLEGIPVDEGWKLRDGKDIAVISIESIGNKAGGAIVRVESESGRGIVHHSLRLPKPLDEELLHGVGHTLRHIVTIEDGTIRGEMGSAVLEFMTDHECTPTVKRIGIPDRLVQYDTAAELCQFCGVDRDSLAKELLKQCEFLPDTSKIKELTN